MDFLIGPFAAPARNLEVDFFGGEPLMNWDVVKELVAYCPRAWRRIHNKNFRFTLTTNGVLIDDDVIDFCNREMHNVVLSPGWPQGSQRPLPQGLCRPRQLRHRSCPSSRSFVKKRGDKNYYMRGTYTHYNTDFTNDIFHMADLGFTELSMEPVVSKPGDPSALTAEDLPILKEQYEILAKEMITPRPRGPWLHLLPLYDGPDRRPLHLQAHLGLRFRHRVHGRDPLGRPVPLPPVRGRPQAT